MPSKRINGIYRMPAEWERQKSTWIAWPHNEDDWPGKFNGIPWVFSKIVSEISKVQKVNILVKDNTDKKKAIFFLKTLNTNLKKIRLIICKTDRAWTRDYLPIFLKNDKNRNILSNWEFNAWAKYKNFKK